MTKSAAFRHTKMAKKRNLDTQQWQT